MLGVSDLFTHLERRIAVTANQPCHGNSFFNSRPDFSVGEFEICWKKVVGVADRPNFRVGRSVCVTLYG